MFVPFEPHLIPSLSHLRLDEVKQMIFEGTLIIRSYPKQTVIHSANEPVTALEIVIMGATADATGHTYPLYSCLTDESLVINQEHYFGDIIAVEDTLLLIIPRKTLLNIRASAKTQQISEHSQ